MSIRRLFQDEVVIHKISPGGGFDEYGNPQDAVTQNVNHQGRLEQTDSQEMQLGRETVIVSWLLLLPPEADIDASDEVTVNGNKYQVVGNPNYLRTAKRLHHIEVRLRSISG